LAKVGKHKKDTIPNPTEALVNLGKSGQSTEPLKEQLRKAKAASAEKKLKRSKNSF
jgi:hypothetical protein